MSRTIGSLLVLSTVAALAAGCGSGAKKEAPAAATAMPAGPEWVNKGTGAFKDTGGTPVFYGVGLFNGSKNPALARESADNRACADIAKILDRYIAALSKDFMEATTGGDPNATSDGQHVERVLKSKTQVTLRGAMPIDHWKDPSDGTMYALCKLDMGAFKNTLDQAKELDAKTRDFVRANAEKAFDELAAEEAKSR
ncbi:MAG: hypothetical protein HY554_08415 [Elusimicrobia bacterium]|nr:hypothetical protein [Elusimicrobiota bacterium]